MYYEWIMKKNIKYQYTLNGVNLFGKLFWLYGITSLVMLCPDQPYLVIQTWWVATI